MPYAGSSSSTSTASPVDGDHGAVLGAVRAQLHRDVGPLQPRGRGAAPARLDPGQPVHRQPLARTDGDGAGDRLDVEHEPRLAVRRGPAEPEPLALADREPVGAVVPAELLRRPRRGSRRPGWARGRRASRAASPGCRRSRRSRCRGCPACPRPAARARRPPRARRPWSSRRAGTASAAAAPGRARRARRTGPCRGRPRGASRPAPSAPRAQLGVVAGRDRVEAEPERPVEHRGELDLLVAPQARVGRAPGGVLVHEVLDHVLVEPVGEVPDVERDADHVGGPAGVVRVLDRAAAAGARAVRRGVAREGEVDAGDVVAGLDGPGRGDRGVHAAGHGGEDLHRLFAARARSTAGPIASTTASTSACGRGVAEREPQRVPGGLLVAAHREQHVRGLRDAGRAGRARSSTRCRGRRAASAASRPRSRGSRGGRCRAAGARRAGRWHRRAGARRAPPR